MNPNKVFSLIGLAQKAGKVVSGEFSTEKAVKAGRAKLVIVSREASENTKKLFQNLCNYYNVNFCLYGDKEELGAAIGKSFRASLAVTDAGLAGAIEKQLLNEKDGGKKYGENQST